MLREARKGARALDRSVTLKYSSIKADEYGRTEFTATSGDVTVFASVTRMSAQRTLLTFQLADVVGLEIIIRMPAAIPTGLVFEGHEVHFATPEDVEGRGRYLRIVGYYQDDVING